MMPAVMKTLVGGRNPQPRDDAWTNSRNGGHRPGDHVTPKAAPGVYRGGGEEEGAPGLTATGVSPV